MNDMIPIFSSLTGEGDEIKYVEIPLKNIDSMMKLYLNYHPSIPKGKFLYDFFGDGELYYNHAKNEQIVNARLNLKVLYENYFMDETSPLRVQPLKSGITFGALAESYPTIHSTGDNPFYGWMFDISEFFNMGIQTTIAPQKANIAVDPFSASDPLELLLDQNNMVSLKAFLNDAATSVINMEIEEEKIDFPVCKYFSFVIGDFEIKSEEYKFANHIPGVTSCSHKNVSNTNTVSTCGWPISNQTKCSMYSPKEEVITRVAISPKNTTQSFEIELTSYITPQNKKFFRVFNKSSNTSINTLAVPTGISEEDAIKEANSVLDEYISHYTNNNDSLNVAPELPPVKEVKSFIETLVPTVGD